MSASKSGSLLERKPFILAIIVFVAVVLWVASGAFSDKEPIQSKSASEQPQLLLAKVQVRHIKAQNVSKNLTLYGRTEPNRQVELKAEAKGAIIEVIAKRGSKVSKGQPLLRIAPEARALQLATAKADLEQRRIEFEGIQALKQQGLQGELTLATTQAALDNARAQVRKIELELEKTVIRAPFDGVFNERHVEVGQYVGIGDRVGTVTDLNPLIVRADVTEADVSYLQKGSPASATFVDNTVANGTIRFISTVSNPNTNTFKVELAIDNEQGILRAGRSAELSIPLETQKAIKISPALLALDEQGNLGIKGVNSDNTVEFHPIQLVKADGDEVWTSGVGDEIDVISLGQGFVRAGDQVEIVREQSGG
ncbi:efflux RND transporter periplasmic adaptor subunit [Paraferrimonas haliotis]|uniref:Hemolysin D n=1 Tax=Paraferrimonas haliotis TaxID=2013866 RepID=A0AA37TRV2_9GAMM|nr:efflux RND transporter periplasmic adaptor subunit [Paraferrimonas haliotis]GLS83127.1 hemolysin D [Paraferrimonas haliotis]